MAEAIARFPWFRREDAVTYDVDWSSRRVTVAALGLPARVTGYDFMSAYDWARFGLLHL